MRTTLYQVFLLIAGMLFVPHIWGQTGVSGFDSVAIIKPNGDKNLYQFSDNGAKEIQFWNKQPKLVKNQANPGLRDLGNGAMTVLTGIGFTSSADGNWEVAGKIQCNDTLPDWNVSLFCEGYKQKDRERIRNDDGSWSVETNETNVYSWDKNAKGAIIEGNDSIGFFLIIMNPREDTLLKHWSSSIFPLQEPPQNAKSKKRWNFSWKPADIDNGISGIFRGKNFDIISNGTDHKTWVYIDNVFICMFHSAMYYPGMSKKDHFIPYILINRNILTTDRRDLFRLAMMSRFLSNSLSMR